MFKRKKRRSKEFKNSGQVIDIEEVRDHRRRKREEAAEKKGKAPKTKTVITERRASKKARRRMVITIILIIVIVIIGVSVFNIVSFELNKARVERNRKLC